MGGRTVVHNLRFSCYGNWCIANLSSGAIYLVFDSPPRPVSWLGIKPEPVVISVHKPFLIALNKRHDALNATQKPQLFTKYDF